MAEHLIIGDGCIGREVAAWLGRRGEAVTMTTRRSETLGPSRILLDLAECPPDWEPKRRFDTVFLCAGRNPRQCQQDSVASRRVNVTMPLAIARRAIAAGAFVVKLSSNAVFDGSRSYQSVGERHRPQSLYGRQHSEMDNALVALGEGAAVVRFSKVMTPDVPVFDGWIDAWARGLPVRPLSDLCMAPIPLPFVAELIARAGLERRPGTFQASGARDVSYAEVARLASEHLGVSPELVQPATRMALGLEIGRQPRYTTLDMTETEQAFSMSAPTIEEAVAVFASSADRLGSPSASRAVMGGGG